MDQKTYPFCKKRSLKSLKYWIIFVRKIPFHFFLGEEVKQRQNSSLQETSGNLKFQDQTFVSRWTRNQGKSRKKKHLKTTWLEQWRWNACTVDNRSVYLAMEIVIRRRPARRSWLSDTEEILYPLPPPHSPSSHLYSRVMQSTYL